MPSLFDFDVRLNGITCLLEKWKRDQEESAQLWQVDDFVRELTRLSAEAKCMFDHFRLHGEFPNPNVRFSKFLTALILIKTACAAIDNIVREAESRGNAVADVAEFREGWKTLAAIIDEDQVATNASFFGGALNDWN
jgi:hypothetical protein